MRLPRQAVHTFLLAALVLVNGCASRSGIRLPAGPGRPLTAYAATYEAATAACRQVSTMELVLALRGQVGGTRIRGRVRAALARPSSVRLEGVAPFGPPRFVLVAAPGRAVLVLPRDREIVTGAELGELLAVLTGLPLEEDDLHAVLTGCLAYDARPTGGRAHPGGWAVVDLAPAGRVYLRSVDDELIVVAGSRPGLFIEYFDHVRGLPRRVAVRTTAAEPVAMVAATMSQVHLNIDLPPAVFEVEGADAFRAITLDEWRPGAGPLAEPSPR